MNNALNAVEPKSPWISIDEQSLALGPLLERSQVRVQAKNAIDLMPISAAWQDIDYRQAAMEGTVENMIAWQVRINREERGLRQDQLATRMGTGQSAISRLEDPEGGDVLVSTLVKAAHAFDCALLVRFVDYAEFAAATHDVRPERLFAAGFSNPSKTIRVARRRTRVIEHGKQ